MFRTFAATCFLWAAIDGPTWWLDRVGVALVGLAFAVFALPPRPRREPEAEQFAWPAELAGDPTEVDAAVEDVLSRIRAYSAGGAGVGSRDGEP